ncbi:MAG TPA: MFS transporter [Candidatus Sulfomarinibacteraceae bacterium]|nr:MFS transporter [Candidatus Sulfomarinibacteraceae bacterium]
MPLRQIDRRLLTILLIVFVQMVGAAMVLPILPLFAQRQFDMSPSVITLLITAFFAAQFLAGPYMGRLSDQYGRLPVLIASQIGTAISFVMLGTATNVWMLFAARLLDGITGGNIIVAQAYITDITPREERTAALGYIYAVFGLGFIFGPALGGVLSAAMGPRIPFLLAAGAALAAVLITWRVLDETVTDAQREATRTYRQSLALRSIMQNGALILVLLIAFVGQFALGLLQGTFALYSEAVLFAGYDENTVNLGVGLLLAVVGVGQLFTQTVLLKRLLARLGDLRLIFLGSIVRSVGLFIFALFAIPLLGALASLLFAVGMGLLMPPIQSLATQTVPDHMRGGVLGVYQSSVSLATIVATAVSGVIFSLSPTLPYWIGGTISLLALLPALLLAYRLHTKRVTFVGEGS